MNLGFCHGQPVVVGEFTKNGVAREKRSLEWIAIRGSKFTTVVVGCLENASAIADEQGSDEAGPFGDFAIAGSDG